MSFAVQIPVDSTEVADSTVVTHDMNVFERLLRDNGEGSYEKVTKFTMGGGGGRYFREVIIPFGTECGYSETATLPFKEDYIDVGAEIDYQVNRAAHGGIRGGYIDTETSAAFDTVIAGADLPGEESTFYLNPYFSFEREWWGVGAGGLVSTHPLHDGDSEDAPVDTDPAIYPSGHLRIGHLSSIYASGHLWEGVPAYSGGGMVMGGVGVRPVAPLELYAGYCTQGPYQEGAWLGRLTVDLGRSWTILTTVHFPTDYTSYDPFSGETHSDSEYGVGVSLSYRLYRLTPGND